MGVRMMGNALNSTPPIGDNSRRLDVERTAEEIIRHRYLARWLNPKLPYVVRALNAAALAADVTDTEFRHLYIVSRNGDLTGVGFPISREDEAALMRKGKRQVQRVSESLVEKGLLRTVKTFKDGKQ